MTDVTDLCAICGNALTPNRSSDMAVLRCNVRKFSEQRFTVWRCGTCRSIHALDRVKLDDYYAEYPFQRQPDNLLWRFLTRRYIARLRKVGLRRHHSILDYGCGSGLLVEQLRRMGYARAYGYDKHTRAFADAEPLKRTYDFVILQDVIEHVEDPAALLSEAAALTEPGGVLCIGTPNAEEIHLHDSEKFVHSLHQPYHLHILSATALIALAADRGLAPLRRYNRRYADTFLPFGNIRFQSYYAKLFDDTLDLAFEPYRLHWKIFTPKGIALGLFGCLFPHRSETMILFRKETATVRDTKALVPAAAEPLYA